MNNLNKYQQSTSENIIPSIRVNVGLDADIKMILDMDPSIVNFGFDTIDDVKNNKNVLGLPPKTGGYVRFHSNYLIKEHLFIR